MAEAVPIYCQECGRANGPSARRCMWCGLPIIDGAAPNKFEATSVEIDYLDGIERLIDPAPVRLTINSEYIEVREVMPGARTHKIPARDVIEARVVDASHVADGGRGARPFWYWLMLGPFALALPGKRLPGVKKHDYILNVKYRSGHEIRNAVFHREDSIGLSLVNNLARIISMLVRFKSAGR